MVLEIFLSQKKKERKIKGRIIRDWIITDVTTFFEEKKHYYKSTRAGNF